MLLLGVGPGSQQAHEMKKWDKIDSARDPFRHSLFLIKSGIIKLRRGLDVHRILLVGDCFGLVVPRVCCVKTWD